MTELKWLVVGIITLIIVSILRIVSLKIFPVKDVPQNREKMNKYQQEYPDDEKDNPQEAPTKDPWDPTIAKEDTIELLIKDPGEKRPNE